MPDIITSGLAAIERLLNDSDHAECENLNFITCDKLNINLGKTYAKLRIFPKIFCKSGPWFIPLLNDDCFMSCT